MSSAPAMDRDPVPGDGEAAALLRQIARDVAHELRTPVQSIVINIEVLRSRIRRGAVDDAIERAAIIEREALRMHRLADAYLSLLRSSESGPQLVAAEFIAASIDPLIEVIARASRITLERSPIDSSLLIHVCPESASLALLCIAAAMIEEAGEGGTVGLIATAGADSLTMAFKASRKDNGAPIDGSRIRQALRASAHWLHRSAGTASVDPGSDSMVLDVRVTFPRSA